MPLCLYRDEDIMRTHVACGAVHFSSAATRHHRRHHAFDAAPLDFIAAANETVTFYSHVRQRRQCKGKLRYYAAFAAPLPPLYMATIPPIGDCRLAALYQRFTAIFAKRGHCSIYATTLPPRLARAACQDKRVYFLPPMSFEMA